MSHDKLLKIILFNGEQKKWFMWSTCHRAKLRLSGLLGILDGEVTIEPDGKLSYTQDEEEARQMNDEVYADLVLSVNDPSCFNTIFSARTKSLKEGDAALAWKKLCERFANSTRSSKVSVSREFKMCRLEKNTKP